MNSPSRLNQDGPIIKDICPSEAQDLLRSPLCAQLLKGFQDLMILDVRTPDEYSACHLEGSINIDFKSSSFREQIIGLNRNKVYLIYCRTGRRSSFTAKLMNDLGFQEIWNLTGGINRWQGEGFSVVKD